MFGAGNGILVLNCHLANRVRDFMELLSVFI